MIVVEGVNVKKKTVQPKPGTEEKGQIVQTESPIHHSNAMLYSKEKEVRSRVGRKCAFFSALHCCECS
jgi:large subunit ribosomal protein L24